MAWRPLRVLSTSFDRSVTVASLSHWTFIFVQQDKRNAARRAGPSATAETCESFVYFSNSNTSICGGFVAQHAADRLYRRVDASSTSEVTTLWRYTNLFIIIIIIIILFFYAHQQTAAGRKTR